MSKKLVLFTSEFPFGKGETFLETEIAYLSKGFDSVHIISSYINSEQTRTIPENCTVQQLNLTLNPFEKIGSFRHLFSSIFREEIRIIRKKYKIGISSGILKTMLISLSRAKLIFRESSKLAYELGSDTQLYFYSYWSDDVAIGLGMLQKKFPELITFCRAHRWDLYFEESEYSYLPYRTFLVNSIGRIFSISQDGIEYIRDYWKEQDMSKIVLSRLGVSNSHPFRLSNNEIFTLVSCSNLIKVKRVDLIAKALGEINDLKIKWVHFGDGACRETIEEFIQNMPDGISVELKGSVSNKEIYAYYAKVKPDLFINVSSSEGVPVSIMEAMSFGIPVIAADVGGNREIVNSMNGSLLAPIVSEKSITDEILAFIHVENKEKLGFQMNSFNTWYLNYNSEENYKKFVKMVLVM